MALHDPPAAVDAGHEERVLAALCDELVRMFAGGVARRAVRAGISEHLPQLERVHALLWELGLVDHEPDVELLVELRGTGLVRRPVSYVPEVEAEDADDPSWWLQAAEEVGEIPAPVLRRWRRELVPAEAGREAGSDAESE